MKPIYWYSPDPPEIVHGEDIDCAQCFGWGVQFFDSGRPVVRVPGCLVDPLYLQLICQTCGGTGEFRWNSWAYYWRLSRDFSVPANEVITEMTLAAGAEDL